MLKTTCRLCNSADLERVCTLPALPLVDAYSREPNAQPLYPCAVNLCRSCGHIQLAHVVDPALLYSDYLFFTADYPWLVEHYRQYAAHAYAEFLPGFVVEIGSNDGTLLKMFETLGAEVLGVDPSNVPAGVQTRREYFNAETAASILHEYRPANMIIANHVFAHIDDLESVVRGVKTLLAKGGVFIFEAAYGLDLLREHYFDTIYHEHLDYHTVAPLVRFFRRLGLELFRIEHNGSKGGTIRGYVGHAAERGAEASVREALREEYAAQAGTAAPWATFNARLEERRKRVHEALGDDSAIGYGAAAGGIATMYHLGLQDRIRWLVDDSLRRHDMHAPHSNLLVKSPDTLYSVRERDLEMPEANCVVLAWRYAEAIKKRHPNLEIIVP